MIYTPQKIKACFSADLDIPPWLLISTCIRYVHQGVVDSTMSELASIGESDAAILASVKGLVERMHKNRLVQAAMVT